MHPPSVVASTGAYATVTVWLPPGATVKGPAGEAVNSAEVPLQRDTDETVRSALPVFETVAVCEAELPTVTVPNGSVVGATEILGAAVTWGWPVPLTLTRTVPVAVSLLASWKQPLSAVASAGAYVTVTVAERPAATVNDAGAAVNSVDVPAQRETELTVSEALPAFETVTDWDAGLPTVTVPKESEVGETAILGTASGAGKLFASPGSVRAVISARFVKPSPSESFGSAVVRALEMPDAMLFRSSWPYGLNVLVPPLPWHVEQLSSAVPLVLYFELNDDKYVDLALAANGADATSAATSASFVMRCIGVPFSGRPPRR
jgi:hypothetical protein